MGSDSEQIARRATQAYRDGTTGDFRASGRLLDELKGEPCATTQAWSLALSAQYHQAQPERGAPVAPETFREFVDESAAARTGAALACAEGARHAIVTNDLDALRTWSDLQQQLVHHCEDPWAIASAKVTLAWIELAQGDSDHAEQLAEEAASYAKGKAVASAIIEATVVRALCAEAQERITAATDLARRGSRMARTEDLPQLQYLASLVLARMRRLNGFPHLTTRILRPLLKVAPAQWHGWIAWEALMAGALALGSEITLDPSNDPFHQVRTLQRLMRAASQGDASGFAEAAGSLSALEQSWPWRKTDFESARLAIDPAIPIDRVPIEVAPWYRGSEPTPPPAIRGLCIDADPSSTDQGVAVFVVAGPTTGPNAKSPRRIAGLGEPLVQATLRLRHVRGGSERAPAILAAIALAGPHGTIHKDLFRTVYGFPYDDGLHRKLIIKQVSRARKDLGDGGNLVAMGDDGYVIELSDTVVLPDPRCERSVEDVMLQALALKGASSAKAAAAQLSIPLRTAQAAIKVLVESGALVAERDGKHIKYVVEDTTFSEPTKWG